MPRRKLTDQTVKSLIAKPTKVRTDHFDKLLPGFGLRVSPAGVGSWFVFYRLDGKLIRDIFARYPAKPLADARDEARNRLDVVGRGRDPRQEEARRKAQAARQRAETFGKIADDYKVAHLRKLRSGDELWAAIEADFIPEWRDLPIRDLARGAIKAKLDQIEVARGPYARNRRLALIRNLLNFALDGELVDANVASRLKMLPEAERDRVLTDGELLEIWNAAGQLVAPSGALVRELILSGQRRDEVSEMEWPEIAEAEALWTVPAARMKSKLVHEVPLTSAMLALIQGVPAANARKTYVFGSPYRKDGPIGGFSQLKDELDVNIARPHEHDIRRGPDMTLAVTHRTRPADKNEQVILTAKGHSPFSRADEGRLIGIAQDGTWGYVRCVKFLTPATMACRIVEPVGSLAPSDIWSLGWTPWRLHDLRRTMRSGLSRLRVPAEIAERVIGHVPGGIRRVYDRFEYRDEKRQALDAWSAYVMALVNPNPKASSIAIGAQAIDWPREELLPSRKPA